MELIKFYNDHNVSTFEDVRDLLATHNIKVKDEGDLYLVYYKREAGNTLNPLQLASNGVIFQKETNKLVCNSYYKFLKENGDLNVSFKSNFGNLVFENCFEGTLIRMFHHNGQWRISTKKCIDANESKWQSDKSFYELFQEAMGNSIYTGYEYKTDCVYFFLLQHPENSVVFEQDNPSVRLLDVFRIVDNVVQIVPVNDGRTNRVEMRSYDELVGYMNGQTMETMKYQGLVVYNRDNPFVKQRMYFNLYNEAYNLYGNTSSRFVRFLELRKSAEDVKKYVTFFPRHKAMFLDYEKNFIDFADKVHALYLSCKVFKNDVIIKKNFRRFIYDLHGNYLKTRVPLSLVDVINHLMKLDRSLVEFLYNDYNSNGLSEKTDQL